MVPASESHFVAASRFMTGQAAEVVAPAVRVRFGPYELDTKAGELRLGERKIVLPDQPHKILLMLIKRPGEIVTRDEIQKQLWADDVIVSFEVSINQAIRKLRRALNDSAEEPKYVETIGRRGYRLKVPVAVESDSDPTRRRTDHSPEHRLQELMAGKTSVADRPEDMKVMATALVRLLLIVADLESPMAELSQVDLRLTNPRLAQSWK